MEEYLKNSFYYFFSSNSQVLAALLALFGVFLMFIIQALKDKLILIASELPSLIMSLNSTDDIDITKKRIKLREKIIVTLKSKNISVLKHFMNDVLHFFDEDRLHQINGESIVYSYNETFFLYRILLKYSIILSIITASTIVICLAIIPYGYFFIAHKFLLNFLFVIVILANIFIFIGLILILKIALDEKFSNKMLVVLKYKNENPIIKSELVGIRFIKKKHKS